MKPKSFALESASSPAPRPASLHSVARTSRATIRVLAENDVPAVVALVARVYPQQQGRWGSPGACESYFREMIFNNPWRDPALPSWVAEENGRVCGCYIVMARAMRFRGRPIRVAAACQFMVDRDQRHSLTALQLAKACLTGPQDLTLADSANELSRRLWVRIGGSAPLLYSLHWTRPLRPARYALSRLEERAALPPYLTLPARALGIAADALIGRLQPNRFVREESEFADQPLDAAAMLDHWPEVFDGNALQPMYDARSLAWLLDQVARKTAYGALRARAVLDSEQRPIGWYLYYARAGGVGEVIQIAARNASFDHVLKRLLADAWRQGATAVRGRVDPRHAQELSDRHCWFRREGPWTLVHSRRADILHAIQQGDAFLSRLEGEWWLRFLGD